MSAITQTLTARNEAINEALYDAVCDGDGRPRPDALAHHLAKRGLVIVEASCPPIEPRIAAFDATLAHPDAKTLIARAARIAREGCLVPPDGGSPTEEERQMCARIAESIEDLL